MENNLGSDFGGVPISGCKTTMPKVVRK